MLKYSLEYFRPYIAMYRNTFGFSCLRIIILTYTTFNSKHVRLDLNNMYEFHGIWRIFTRTAVRADRQEEYLNIFPLCWKVLKMGEKKDSIQLNYTELFVYKKKNLLVTIITKFSGHTSLIIWIRFTQKEVYNN